MYIKVLDRHDFGISKTLQQMSLFTFFKYWLIIIPTQSLSPSFSFLKPPLLIPILILIIRILILEDIFLSMTRSLVQRIICETFRREVNEDSRRLLSSSKIELEFWVVVILFSGWHVFNTTRSFRVHWTKEGTAVVGIAVSFQLGLHHLHHVGHMVVLVQNLLWDWIRHAVAGDVLVFRRNRRSCDPRLAGNLTNSKNSREKIVLLISPRQTSLRNFTALFVLSSSSWENISYRYNEVMSVTYAIKHKILNKMPPPSPEIKIAIHREKFYSFSTTETKIRIEKKRQRLNLCFNL